MPKKDRAKLISVKIKIPWVGEAEWNADPRERSAAWALYVELVTRIAVQPLPANEGSLREALTSLHSLFDSTRQILREAGPDVGASITSVGGIAIAVLNRGIRPFLSLWHPALSDWESRKDGSVSSGEHERKWSEHDQLRSELNKLQVNLESYAEGLATIAGVTIQQ
ncbi:MAG: hypothetical protein ACREDR_30505 [Blastocatellia bacterium]